MLQGFKDFIMRGNVVDLAVAVVIGGAFTAIVTAFSDNLINPLIAALGGSDVSGLGFHVISGNPATFLDFGAVITAAINFLMIAAVVYFVIVMPMNKMKELQERRRGIEKEEEAPAPTDVELLTEIRDLLQKS
ncbi:large-conductance mechanosensitive channel protein MscL [Corynebacterium testudinoris]|uniref:Large-conductance mechanosensitive channel n=1 Tax=Corynebacterium testudinoris TaxID=136857 RepID=A0A0G3H648_9CORY|nr:large-conductance mechanosensitive channel protein MscL [Corynebacterium testudinoris]AKK08210.1 large conductance mechanosensitive channel protein [Corynebacterium testudinoris]MBX8995655.1 large-conductance mechanosensitive channel protein MscL [Corynebacterium testudinoris]